MTELGAMFAQRSNFSTCCLVMTSSYFRDASAVFNFNFLFCQPGCVRLHFGISGTKKQGQKYEGCSESNALI